MENAYAVLKDVIERTDHDLHILRKLGLEKTEALEYVNLFLEEFWGRQSAGYVADCICHRLIACAESKYPNNFEFDFNQVARLMEIIIDEHYRHGMLSSVKI